MRSVGERKWMKRMCCSLEASMFNVSQSLEVGKPPQLRVHHRRLYTVR